MFKYYYDCENRLMEVTDANGDPVASYRYDFAGRRVSKTAGGVTTKYVYDGDQVIAEYDGNDTLLRKFVYGPGTDEPICMHRTIAGAGAGLFYYHYDGLGSVVALSDSVGDIVERYTYDVFGEPTILAPNNELRTISSYGNPYMFTGRRFDDETGLYYYRFRYYEPRMGRFLQTDPIGYYGGLNLYNYCGNNPLNWIDPWGLIKEDKRSWWDKLVDWLLGRDDPEDKLKQLTEPITQQAPPNPAGAGEALLQTTKMGGDIVKNKMLQDALLSDEPLENQEKFENSEEMKRIKKFKKHIKEGENRELQKKRYREKKRKEKEKRPEKK